MIDCSLWNGCGRCKWQAASGVMGAAADKRGATGHEPGTDTSSAQRHYQSDGRTQGCQHPDTVCG